MNSYREKTQARLTKIKAELLEKKAETDKDLDDSIKHVEKMIDDSQDHQGNDWQTKIDNAMESIEAKWRELKSKL